MMLESWHQWVYWILVAVAFKLAILSETLFYKILIDNFFCRGKGSRILSSFSSAFYIAVWLNGCFVGTHKALWVGIGFGLSF